MMKTKKLVVTEQKNLQQFIEYYEFCNRAEDKSPRTINWYTHNLNYFCNYLKSKKLPYTLDKIDINTLRQYILYLLKKNKYAGHPLALNNIPHYRHQPFMVTSVPCAPTL
jgi:site-specific recombinase XerD